MFKVNNKDTRIILMALLWCLYEHISLSFSIVNFEQVNPNRVIAAIILISLKNLLFCLCYLDNCFKSSSKLMLGSSNAVIDHLLLKEQAVLEAQLAEAMVDEVKWLMICFLLFLLFYIYFKYFFVLFAIVFFSVYVFYWSFWWDWCNLLPLISTRSLVVLFWKLYV